MEEPELAARVMVPEFGVVHRQEALEAEASGSSVEEYPWEQVVVDLGFASSFPGEDHASRSASRFGAWHPRAVE